MFFFKKKENLFVDILDLKVDYSKIINIKKAKLVYVNGKGKLTVEIGKSEHPNWEAPSKIKLNDIPLIQAKIPDCPTCCAFLATGYGIENTNCKELLEIQEKINSDYINLETSINYIKPLLTLFKSGFYLIADAICYPTDGENFFWNVPNELKEFLSAGPAYLGEGTYVFDQPVYLYPTQTTNSYNKDRVDYYIEKFKNSADNKPRAIVYNFEEFINFIIDGHHKACASALLKEPVSCILIIPDQIFNNYYENTCLNFSGILVDYKDIPKEYSKYIKKEKFFSSQEKIEIKDGIVNNREWGEKYINSPKYYPSLLEYANVIDIMQDNEIEVNDIFIKNCLENFDKDSQLKIKKLLYLLKFTDIKKAQEIALKYARKTLREEEIDKELKKLVYKILLNDKNNEEVENIFIDYIVYYSDNKEDPVLNIINSYWEKN
ncbi:hypothetical protein YWH7199_04070 [Fusobacterium nucleatum YWH7199]|uniref:Uncharacterized protein n=1 Tax=Fusobacterium nucleatum TaxID=851 RepID=A0A133NEN3_FUSNU|nr:hypothetical protein [Fusobacterium nucleatum]KXA14744.1 hypothetical protein HMPREF3221_02269 [Fusobacterium nucleatum]MCL4576481.1 hypothetical protein [Fusobacterium nucleatum YWH7056]MCL4580669.1 hypothetical protein [Fusobacterium nucleatum YWH7199]MCL4584123.1 hypothetical protein [Fusobacterium nucleatum YWH7054]MCL4593155.1 hypothetical protein [Fusobacterium nucleatum YWH7053]